jgi:hypothetical protein
MTLNQIRLDDLLARDLDVQWFEGVALVQAVCRQVMAGGAAGFPPASEIVLMSSGMVAIGVGSSAGSPVTAAAHLLAAMLKDDVPVRLRLAVSQATSPGDVYPSLREFSEAVAYFERPDSAQVLAALFERASGATPKARDAEPQQSASDAASEEKWDASQLQPRKRRSGLVAVAALAVVALSSAAWVLGSDSGPERLASAVSTVTAAIERGLAPSPAPAPVPAVEKDTKPASRPPRAAVSRTSDSTPVARRVQRVESRVTPSDVYTLSWLPALTPIKHEWRPNIWTPFEAPIVFYSSVEIPAGGAMRPNVVDSPRLARLQPDPSRIYSRADAGVVPPRSIYPRLPDLPAGIRLEDQTVLELVINVKGTVDRADLRSIPRDIHEFMLVSAAKTWQFDPATVDGQPVKYRHRIHLVLP